MRKNVALSLRPLTHFLCSTCAAQWLLDASWNLISAQVIWVSSHSMVEIAKMNGIWSIDNRRTQQISAQSGRHVHTDIGGTIIPPCVHTRANWIVISAINLIQFFTNISSLIRSPPMVINGQICYTQCSLPRSLLPFAQDVIVMNDCNIPTDTYTLHTLSHQITLISSFRLLDIICGFCF